MFYMAVETFWDTAGRTEPTFRTQIRPKRWGWFFRCIRMAKRGLLKSWTSYIGWDGWMQVVMYHGTLPKWAAFCIMRPIKAASAITNPTVMAIWKGILSRWYQKRCGTDVSRFCCPALHGSSTRTAKSTNICGIRQNLSGQQSCGVAVERALSSSNGE